MTNLVKWAGGKALLVEELEKHFRLKKNSFYVEPFLGGGGSFLNIKGEFAAGCDTNKSLIYLWETVRDEPETIVSWYDYYHSVHTESSYYAARDVYNNLINDGSLEKCFVSQQRKTDIAGVFFYLMKTCYNGLCRYSKKGIFNVPIGDKVPTVRSVDEKLTLISKQLQGCSFHAWDFETTINFYKDKTNVFIYCDPPYSRTPGGKEFQDYTENWQRTDPDRLKKVLINSRCDFAVSEIDCPEVRERYAGYPMIELWANRSIGGKKGQKREKVRELLIVSRLT